MAFLSRLFKRGDPLAEREEARRQGMRDAREHPLGEFTDPEFQPAYVTEIRARAREQVTQVDRRLAATRTSLLERALQEREVILRELGRGDTRPERAWHANGHSPGPSSAGTTPPPAPPSSPPSNLTSNPPPDRAHAPSAPRQGAEGDAEGAHGSDAGSSAGSGAGGEAGSGRDGGGRAEDEFISIAEARTRRAEARRRVLVEEANANVQRARARIEHLTQEWESALIERDHEVEAVHARAEQLIAAYKSGVLRVHPRKEEIPALWKGEVIAMDAATETPTAIAGWGEIGRILREVEGRIEVWHAEIMPREPPEDARRELTPPPAEEGAEDADRRSAHDIPDERPASGHPQEGE